MFIWDSTSIIVLIVSFIMVYAILEFTDNEAFKTVESKIFVSLAVAMIIAIGYAFFMSGGSEDLLNENYIDAASKFGALSGMDSIKAMADI